MLMSQLQLKMVRPWTGSSAYESYSISEAKKLTLSEMKSNTYLQLETIINGVIHAVFIVTTCITVFFILFFKLFSDS